jgi:predicted transcriptional regulator
VKRNEARKPKSRMISFRVDEDDFIRLDTLAHQTSCSRAEVVPPQNSVDRKNR